MPRDKATLEELDAAIADLGRSAAQGSPPPRPRRGIVPISEQVREVARATGEAYEDLKAEMERAAAEGRLVIEVEPAEITDSAHRDRDERAFGDAAFLELVASIRDEGQIAPVALRRLPQGGYETVFGHRRVRACRTLGRKVRAVVLEGDDKALVRRMLIENAVRRDLSPIEKAKAWQRLLASGLFTRQELGATLQVTPQQISNVVVLAGLPDELLELVGDWRELGINAGRRLLAAFEAAGRRLPPALAERVRAAGGGAAKRAQLLTRGLVAAGREEGEGTSELIRARDGRRLARLTRAGGQLVLRFQPDLDEAVVRALVRRLPELLDELQPRR
ncbi:ParB/RepB/Spo0J family partition protein [Benzoatithermus flavus]|uniref:ParB/RepB/Spo0J family partition protein n=1 Tax=Benzoatithermus flavus TaxID=3108223 RepID=A0ABU8XRX2_9PROT